MFLFFRFICCYSSPLPLNERVHTHTHTFQDFLWTWIFFFKNDKKKIYRGQEERERGRGRIFFFKKKSTTQRAGNPWRHRSLHYNTSWQAVVLLLFRICRNHCSTWFDVLWLIGIGSSERLDFSLGRQFRKRVMKLRSAGFFFYFDCLNSHATSAHQQRRSIDSNIFQYEHIHYFDFEIILILFSILLHPFPNPTPPKKKDSKWLGGYHQIYADVHYISFKKRCWHTAVWY